MGGAAGHAIRSGVAIACCSQRGGAGAPANAQSARVRAFPLYMRSLTAAASVRPMRSRSAGFERADSERCDAALVASSVVVFLVHGKLSLAPFCLSVCPGSTMLPPPVWQPAQFPLKSSAPSRAPSACAGNGAVASRTHAAAEASSACAGCRNTAGANSERPPAACGLCSRAWAGRRDEAAVLGCRAVPRRAEAPRAARAGAVLVTTVWDSIADRDLYAPCGVREKKKQRAKSETLG